MTSKFTLNDIMVLGDIADQQKQAVGPPTKRARNEDTNNGISMSVVICQSIEDIWKEISKENKNKEIDINTIELEVRLGMLIMDHERRWRAQRPCNLDTEGACNTKSLPLQILTTLEFKAGVDEITIERIRKILNDKKRFNKCILPIQKVKIDKDMNRWIVNDDGYLKKGEQKSRIEKNDCALLAHQYDIRIDSNYEIPISVNDDSNSSIDQDFKPKNERIKRRTTYTSILPDFKSWKIDVTEVNSISFNERGIPYGSNHEFEVEFELVDRELFKESTLEKAIPIIKYIGTQLYNLINLFIPNDTAKNPGQLMTPCGSPYIYDQIRQLNGMITGFKDGNDFIGSMPINLTRSSFKKVLRTDYYLTEKSDGTRYLLYIVAQDEATKTPIAVLIDRAKNIFKMQGAEIIGSCLGLGTVLDGELVFNFTTKTNIFLTFDILSLNKEPKVSLNFKKRLEILKQLMISYHSRLPPKNNDIIVTTIVDKLFVEKRQISTLLSKILSENGERVFKDGDGRARHHHTDGIIFQPDSPYIHSTDQSLLKWKWSELRSVDLELVQPVKITDGARLQCSGPENTRIDCINGQSHSKLGIFDTYRLNADAQVSYNKIVIAEVVFDEKVGKWGYLRLRKDKMEPNYIATVMSVSMEQSEALSIEELEFRLIAKNETEDDWDIHYSNMLNQVLTYQKGRVSKTKT